MSKPALHHASTFARVGLLVYGLLIIYASLYPFTGWRDKGIAPDAFIAAPLPYYWTVFDALTNIIAYIPLGWFAVYACYPRVRGVAALIIACTGGMLLSGGMEALQTYLPTRVSSNLDFYTNSTGTMVGAVIGVFSTATFLEQSPFLNLRRDWFTHEAGRGLIVVGLWPLAQIYPQGYLFGNGQFVPIISDWLSRALSSPIDVGALLRNDFLPTVEQLWLAEAIITACGMTGALLLFLITLNSSAPRVWLVLGLTALALGVKSLATALLFSPEDALTWSTPGGEGGMLFGFAMLFGLAFAPVLIQRRIAIVMLVISLYLANAMPTNPYFTATMQAWIQGKFLNFNGAAQFLSLLWPFLALWFLFHPTHRKKAS